ncbi:MAG TPA: septal ring lytic transglycosylase RlpA family protein [Solirubrobacterales bacterium]|nr:septal ring lytic transglycosylase RlpA family protein [Solirubrobacterales bacterium]
MKADRNRHGRKDHSRGHAAHARKTGQRLRRFSLATAILSLALAPLAAHAQTGGAGVPSAAPSEEESTGGGLVFSSPMRSAGATWYGPGLYGNGTACGQTLRPGTVGVAHRTLPCGTTIKLLYHGHSLVTKVIDRGPYTPGNDFDLTNGARLALGFEGVGRVRYAVALSPAARHG